MRELLTHSLQEEDLLEQPPQQLDIAGEDEIMERPGIGDDEPGHPLEAEPL